MSIPKRRCTSVNGRRYDGPRIIELDGFDIPVAGEAKDYSWVNQGGGVSGDRGNSVALNAAGDVYVTGEFYQNGIFGRRTLTASGNLAMFLAKYDNAGSLAWLQQISGTGPSLGRSVATDAVGNVYVTGTMEGSAVFLAQPGASLASGTTIESTEGGSDIFIAEYDPSGNLRFVAKAAASGRDLANAITVDIAGDIFVAGSFEGSGSFGPSNLASHGASVGCAAAQM